MSIHVSIHIKRASTSPKPNCTLVYAHGHTHVCRPAYLQDCKSVAMHMSIHTAIHMSIHMYAHMSMHMSMQA